MMNTGRQSPGWLSLCPPGRRPHTHSVLQQLLLGICYQTQNKVCRIHGPGRRIQTNFQMSSGQRNLRRTFSRVLSYAPHPTISPCPPLLPCCPTLLLDSQSHTDFKGNEISLFLVRSHLNPQTDCFIRSRGLPRHLHRLPYRVSHFQSGNCILPGLYVQVQYPRQNPRNVSGF